jgi:hypothetical protein
VKNLSGRLQADFAQARTAGKQASKQASRQAVDRIKEAVVAWSISHISFVTHDRHTNPF